MLESLTPKIPVYCLCHIVIVVGTIYLNYYEMHGKCLQFKEIDTYCQAQPKLQDKFSLKAELALFSFDPATHPPPPPPPWKFIWQHNFNQY